MTTFTEPTGEAWIRHVNKRLAQLERRPSGGNGSISAADLTVGTSVAFEADVMMSSGTIPDPGLGMEQVEDDTLLDWDTGLPLDPYIIEDYSDVIPGEATTDLQYAPVTPSDPIVAELVEGVSVIWDGSGAGGEHIPVNMLLVEVHRSTDPVFTPEELTYVGSFLDAGSLDFTDQEFEVPWYYRFLLVTTDGRRSTPTNAIVAVAHALQTNTTRTNHVDNPRLVKEGASLVFAQWSGVEYIDPQFDAVLQGGDAFTSLYAETVDGGIASTTAFDDTLDGGHA